MTPPAPPLPAGIPATVAAAVDRAATLWPDSEMFVSGDERVTFDALADRVRRIASAMAALGVRRGDHVALCLGNTADWVALFLAGCTLGAVTVPINTRLKADEIAYALRQSRSAFLFLADELLGIDFLEMFRTICPAIEQRLPDPALPGLHRVVVLGRRVPKAALAWGTFQTLSEKPPPLSRPADPVLIQYTSGTTSFPKGAMLYQQAIVADAWFVGSCMGFRAGDRHLSARPFFHVAGSVLSVLTAILHGVTLVSMIRFEPKAALRLAAAERCTHISGNDTMFLMMLAERDLQSGLVVRGGMLACSPPVVQRVIDELGAAEVVTGYGLSEASPNIGETFSDDPVPDRLVGWAPPHPGLAVRIADPETSETLPHGSTGEIRVRGWAVMQGYFDKPAETTAALSDDGELRTGDFGEMRSDGRYRFIGRLKEIIRVGGENVAPADIENVLHQHPSVIQAQAVGVPDPRLVEVPAAFVILRDPVPVDDLLAWCRTRMANFKVPRYLAIVESFDEIGMTASSKIQKSKLAAYARGRFALDTTTPQS